MSCFYCKGQTIEQMTKFIVDLGRCVVIVKNVPGQVCQQCGETSYSDEVAQQLDLGAYLKLGRGEDAGGGRTRPSIVADAVEAVLAAVYLDGGIGSARKIIRRFILDREAEKGASRDFKTALQELVQRESGQVLAYHLLSSDGPDHAKTFTVAVYLNGTPIGQGTGHSKKEAEQMAAKAGMEALSGTLN